jgi:hypothetical protein
LWLHRSQHSVPHSRHVATGLRVQRCIWCVARRRPRYLPYQCILGPACGKCFNLTLLNTYTPDPPFFPTVSKSIVIKVTDLCPLSETGWCSGTQTKKNPYVFPFLIELLHLTFLVVANTSTLTLRIRRLRYRTISSPQMRLTMGIRTLAYGTSPTRRSIACPTGLGGRMRRPWAVYQISVMKAYAAQRTPRCVAYFEPIVDIKVTTRVIQMTLAHRIRTTTDYRVFLSSSSTHISNLIRMPGQIP